MKRLTKSRTNRVLSGMCGGIGEYIGIDPVFIRIIFVVTTFMTAGTAFFVYIVMSMVIPTEAFSGNQPTPQKPQPTQNPQPRNDDFFGHEGFNFKNVVDVNAKKDDDCGCNNPLFDNTSSGREHGESNAIHDEEQFFKQSRDVQDGEYKG